MGLSPKEQKKRFMNKKNRIILLAAMIVAAVSQTFTQGNDLFGQRTEHEKHIAY